MCLCLAQPLLRQLSLDGSFGPEQDEVQQQRQLEHGQLGDPLPRIQQVH